MLRGLSSYVKSFIKLCHENPLLKAHRIFPIQNMHDKTNLEPKKLFYKYNLCHPISMIQSSPKTGMYRLTKD